MRRLIAAMKVSVDSKVEAPGGYADWVDSWSEDYGLSSEIDACVLGGGMYPNYERYWTQIQTAPEDVNPMGVGVPTAGEVGWARFAAATPHYVVSTSLTSAQWSNTTFLPGLAEVRELKERDGKNIYLMGGARILRSCLEAGFVDELRLITYPLVVGEGGTPLFSASSRHSIDLLSVEQRPGGLTYLRYALS